MMQPSVSQAGGQSQTTHAAAMQQLAQLAALRGVVASSANPQAMAQYQQQVRIFPANPLWPNPL